MEEFEQFYLNTKAAVYRYLYQHSKDYVEAEDIAQETYLIALEEWEKVKYHPNPTGWLMMTAKNLCMGYHRHIYYRMVTLEERKDIGYEEPAFDMLVMEDLFENIYNQKEKIIAKRYFLEGDTIKELAKELGVSEGSFRTRLYRMRRRIKLYIESCGGI